MELKQQQKKDVIYVKMADVSQISLIIYFLEVFH